MPWFVVEIGTIQRVDYRDMKLNVDDMLGTRYRHPMNFWRADTNQKSVSKNICRFLQIIFLSMNILTLNYV